MTDDIVEPLSEAETRITYEQKKVEQYLKAREELKKRRNTSNLLRMLQTIPYPKKIFSIVFTLTILAAFITYLPIIGDSVASEWVKYSSSSRDLFLASVGVNFTLLTILGVVFLFARQPVKVWLKSGLLNKPILQTYTKNRTEELIVPKEVDTDMWTIDDKTAVVPDPDAIVIGMHNRPMMMAVPEVGFGFNPRHILEGKDIGIDMTVIRQYGEKHEQKMFHAMRTGSDVFVKFMPWIVVLLVMAAIFGPFFYNKMGDLNESSRWRTQYEDCRIEMVEAGLVKTKPKPDETVEGSDPTEVQPAFMGVSIER